MSLSDIREVLARGPLGKLAFIQPSPEAEPQPVAGPDCEPWCGGRGRLRLPTEDFGVAGQARPFVEIARSIRYRFCPCSVGVAMREEYERAMAEIERQAVEAELARVWERSEIPPKLRRYTFESYLALPGASAVRVEMLRRWQATRADLLIYGSSGTCKTGLAMACVNAAIAAGQTVLYVVTPTYLNRIRTTYDQGGVSELGVLATAIDVDLLLLDDVGKVELSAWGREKLFTLLNEREVWERQTILTTNLEPAQLEEHLGSPTYDRIRGNARDPHSGETFVLEFGGASSRGNA